VTPGLDMPALLSYARAKNVGIILWAVWKTLADQFEPALAQFEAWGIKGVKVDFMQRDDQPVIDFYHRVARSWRKRKMLVDFHGGQRPALMTRTWPNIISTEGVKGLEHLKWSNVSDPSTTSRCRSRACSWADGLHAGRDAERHARAVQAVFKQPMSLGTRAIRWRCTSSTRARCRCWRLAHQLHARGRDDRLHAGRSRRCGTRRACSTRASATTSSSRAARAGLVRRRDDRLDAARAGDRPRVVLAGRPGTWSGHDVVRGRRRTPTRADQLPARERRVTAARIKVKLAPGGGWAARSAASSRRKPEQRDGARAGHAPDVRGAPPA
jgi:hypothetical protein